MSVTSIAIPLYIYPDPEAWAPLYEVISAFPTVHFNIVVNPNNGPGGIVPDSNYIKEVAYLNTLENVALFGYVHVSWGNRDLALVTQDITDWARWREYEQADIHVDGIFVDEAPSGFDKVTYMAHVYKHAKQALSTQAAVWTNPGVDVSQAYYHYADMVNSHENTHTAWRSLDLEKQDAKATTMIHSYTGSQSDLIKDIATLRKQGFCSILITTETCYTSFSQQLHNMVQTIYQT